MRKETTVKDDSSRIHPEFIGTGYISRLGYLEALDRE
jgi:hypothetical protein